MSGKTEKRKRAGQISAAAKRDESEFTRIVRRAMAEHAEQRALKRQRNKRIAVYVALGVVAAVILAIVVL